STTTVRTEPVIRAVLTCRANTISAWRYPPYHGYVGSSRGIRAWHSQHVAARRELIAPHSGQVIVGPPRSALSPGPPGSGVMLILFRDSRWMQPAGVVVGNPANAAKHLADDDATQHQGEHERDLLIALHADVARAEPAGIRQQDEIAG